MNVFSSTSTSFVAAPGRTAATITSAIYNVSISLGSPGVVQAGSHSLERSVDQKCCSTCNAQAASGNSSTTSKSLWPIMFRHERRELHSTSIYAGSGRFSHPVHAQVDSALPPQHHLMCCLWIQEQQRAAHAHVGRSTVAASGSIAPYCENGGFTIQHSRALISSEPTKNDQGA
jgi:hypothetical protein